MTPGKEHRIGSLLPAASPAEASYQSISRDDYLLAFPAGHLPTAEQVGSGGTGKPWEASLHSTRLSCLMSLGNSAGSCPSMTEYLPEARMESPCSKEMLTPGATVPSLWQGTLQSPAQTSIPRGKAHSLDAAPNPAAVAHTRPALLWWPL